MTSLDSDALKRLLGVFADGCLDVVANGGVCLGVSVDALKLLLGVFADGCLDVVAACVSVPVGVLVDVSACVSDTGVSVDVSACVSDAGVSVNVLACVSDAGVVSAASTID